MRKGVRVLWALISFFLFGAIILAQDQKPHRWLVWNTTAHSPKIYSALNEFQTARASAENDFIAFQQYVVDCNDNHTDPTFFYDVAAMQHLKQAEAEFRQSAERLHEVQNLMEHPYRVPQKEALK